MTSFRISASYTRHDVTSRSIKYAWHSPAGVDDLTLEIEDMRYIAPVTLDRYLALCDILLTWQRPRYMWVGDPNYVYKKHGLFDGHRTVANWIAWVPQTVTPAQIPSAHLVRPHLGGTLIVTQPDFFNVRENQPAIDRANAVEYEMNEAGVPPLLTDLH
jgi:Immunity protein 52